MANDVKHILMHVRYLHFSKLLWHIKYRTMTELSDSAVSEALDSLKKDGRIVLPSRRDRDQIYTQAIHTKMIVRHMQGEAMEKTLAWAESEVEGFMRT